MFVKSTSTLIINRDIEQLRALARERAREYNPADVFWLTPNEGANTIQVKETLDFMELAHLAPLGERKLMIICDASTMTLAAQNKTLKTIEDAPAGTNFLLLATSIEPVLNTVRSRCVTFFAPMKKVPLLYGGVDARSAHGASANGVVDILKKIFSTEINEQTLSPAQRYAIMTAQAKINRNVAANCNPQNQLDLLIMEILKTCAKQ